MSLLITNEMRMINIVEHKELTELRLADIQGDGNICRHILGSNCSNITSLELIIEFGGSHSRQMKQIRKLTYHSNIGSDDLFEEIFKSCPHMQQLILHSRQYHQRYYAIASDRTIYAIVQYLHHLAVLSLSEIQVSEEAMLYLCNNFTNKDHLTDLTLLKLPLSELVIHKILETFALENFNCEFRDFGELDASFLLHQCTVLKGYNLKKLRLMVVVNMISIVIIVSILQKKNNIQEELWRI